MMAALWEYHETLGRIRVATGRLRPVLVPDPVRDCVGFAYAVINGEPRPVGTAFFLASRLGDTGRWGAVVVTALHVLAKARTQADDGCLHLRLNTRDGGHVFVKVEDDQWVVPDQTELAVDVAAFAWKLGREEFDFKFISTDQCATDEVVAAESIGVGNELFLTGLFVNHLGSQRNVPIVRVGNIAAVPGEPVQTRLGAMNAYLAESRSVGGLSGSPVFVYLGDLGYAKGKVVRRPAGSDTWYLLGVMHGHWDAPTGQPDIVVDDGLAEEFVNMGIAVVTPITKVLELLEAEPIRGELAAMTREAEELQEKELPSPDTATVEGEDEFERFEDLTRKLIDTPKPQKQEEPSS